MNNKNLTLCLFIPFPPKLNEKLNYEDDPGKIKGESFNKGTQAKFNIVSASEDPDCFQGRSTIPQHTETIFK